MAGKDWRADIRLVGNGEATDAASRPREPGDGFIIAVIGDFRGTAEAGRRPQDAALDRRFADVDRDTFDAFLSRMAPRWDGALTGPAGSAAATRAAVQLTFRQLLDFHPDQLAERVPALREFMRLRRDLSDPTRFEHAASTVTRAPASASASVSPRARKPSELLDEILGESPGSGSPPAPSRADELQAFVEDLVRPHLVRVDAARQSELIGAVDRAASDQMRSILHDPCFQHLEAAWRGLHWLIDRTETGPQLKIRVLHLTRDELALALEPGDRLEDAALARVLLDPASIPDGERPALLVGNYAFSHGAEDVAILGRMGQIAAALGAPFVAAASPELFGCDSFTALPAPAALNERLAAPDHDAWQELRASPAARWLALAMPRWLCRLPYGADTDPVEAFAFEEQLEPDHDALLWANPALAVAAVAAARFAADGWSFDLSAAVERLDGLPLYVYHDDGTALTKPCAEVHIPERLLAAIEPAGLLPLVSYRDSDAVALPCIQSLARPAFPLQCRAHRR